MPVLHPTRRSFGLTLCAAALSAPAAAQDAFPSCLLLPDLRLGRLMADAETRLRALLGPAARDAALPDVGPGEADIRAVYREPLAGRLIADLGARPPADRDIRPGPGHVRVRVWTAWLSDLRDRTAAAHTFDPGHARLAQYMNVTDGNDPAVTRFEWLDAGATRGVAHDALYHVDGRWVLIREPWLAIGA